ncbi:MAG TPA: sugar phosphate isomerase/epimerase [Puia sp.]|nr:sugar phosphate isomerase/epimerase [Puia sp.]
MKLFSFTCLLCFAFLQPFYPIAPAVHRTGTAPAARYTTNTDASGSTYAASPKDWKIGIQLWTFHFVSFVKALDKADSAGVHYLEAFPGQTLGGGMEGTFGIGMSESTKAKVKELLKAKDMHIYAMGVVVPGTIAEWKKYFELAKYFGLSYITAEPRKNQWDAIDSLAGIYHINIAIHDHPKPNVYWHPDSVLAAVRGHQHIGSCADIGHWVRNGLDPVACLKELEGHIYGVHLKDVDQAGNTRAKDMVVGTGVINYPPVFEELKRQHFEGYFSIEREDNWYNNVPDVVATVKFFHAQVRKL